jgi:hemoglobin-like flavoprotein
MHPALATEDAEPAPLQAYVMPLSPAHLGLVRATFQILTADRDRLTEMFYARAVALDPHIQRPQLVSNMVTQRLQFMLVLTEVIQQLDDLPRLAQTATSLARRHGIYGAGDPRFHTARAALTWALGRILETERNSAIQVAWDAALDLVQALLSGGIPTDRPPGR